MDRPTDYCFLLMPGFSAIAFFSAIEPLRIANRLSGETIYSWTVCSPTGSYGEASNGMQVVADGTLKVRPSNLIVCAGFDPMLHCTPELLATLRTAWRMGSSLGAIDTGAFLLAAAGVVGDKPVIVHWEAAEEFSQLYPDIPTSDHIFEHHERLFSCAGGTAAMDMMLETIARTHGSALAVAVSDQLIHDRIRRADDAQRLSLVARLGSRKRALVRVVALMEQNLATPLSISELADRAGATRRQIERQFYSELQQSPARYYRGLRLQLAERLAATTDLSLEQIAAASGFESSSGLTRAYRRQFGQRLSQGGPKLV